jgi:phage repressor protein C with HTH and peptisase S24 domain
MARRKNLPETVRVKCHLSERLREVRTELFGERGGSEMARRLGLPIRTWYNYEAGVTVPAEVLLRFVELTAVEPLWLLHGRGPKFRTATPAQLNGDPTVTVESLLRTALKHLEWRAPAVAASGTPEPHVRVREPLRADSNGGGHFIDPGHEATPSRREWLAAQAEERVVRVEGDAMAPIVADGAQVAYTHVDEPPARLEGKLVVAWIDDDQPVVRWFRQSGRYGLLRAENPEHTPSILLVDLEAPESERRFRRVLWISTPH